MAMKPTDDEGGIRLNHYLAQLGVGSRRACDELQPKGLEPQENAGIKQGSWMDGEQLHQGAM